jgi:hypothetical protein
MTDGYSNSPPGGEELPEDEPELPHEADPDDCKCDYCGEPPGKCDCDPPLR